MLNKKTIPFCASVGASKKSKPRVVTLQFGDGYTQRAGGGANNNLAKLSVTYKLKKHDMQTLIDFLDEHGGYKSFLFKDPHTDKKLLVVAVEWGVVYDRDRATLSAEFEEVLD